MRGSENTVVRLVCNYSAPTAKEGRILSFPIKQIKVGKNAITKYFLSFRILLKEGNEQRKEHLGHSNLLPASTVQLHKESCVFIKMCFDVFYSA